MLHRLYSPSSPCSHISSYSITATTRLFSEAEASANTTGCGWNNQATQWQEQGWRSEQIHKRLNSLIGKQRDSNTFFQDPEFMSQHCRANDFLFTRNVINHKLCCHHHDIYRKCYLMIIEFTNCHWNSNSNSKMFIWQSTWNSVTRTRWRRVKTLGQHPVGVNLQSHAQHQLWISTWHIFHEFHKIMPSLSYPVSLVNQNVILVNISHWRLHMAWIMSLMSI